MVDSTIDGDDNAHCVGVEAYWSISVTDGPVVTDCAGVSTGDVCVMVEMTVVVLSACISFSSLMRIALLGA